MVPPIVLHISMPQPVVLRTQWAGEKRRSRSLKTVHQYMCVIYFYYWIVSCTLLLCARPTSACRPSHNACDQFRCTAETSVLSQLEATLIQAQNEHTIAEVETTPPVTHFPHPLSHQTATHESRITTMV